VYVFIHGGGLVNGSSDQHDGSLIVQTNKIIVVTLNYRLGVFGFLGHPALTAEQGESGNYGFADQQAALRWVHDNIAAFGGDPGRVTIGGESAGGFSVCAHLAAPGSRGLFAAAMIQSGGCGSEPQAVADAAGVAVANRAGCTVAATVLPCLRAASVTDLLAAGRQLSPALVSGTPTLPLDPGQAVLTGRFSRVPVVFGANRDEARSFSMPAIGWSQAQYTGWVQATFGSRAASILTHYPWPATADKFTAAYLVAAIQTDSGAVLGIGGCATRTLAGQFADRVPTFVYEFANRTGPGLDPRLVGYQWGAGHAAELAYLWPSFDNGTPIAATFDAAERRLSGDMVRSWGAFVSYHLPFAWDLPGWPIYSLGHEVLSLRPGGHSTLITDATYSAEHQCGFWTGRSSG
jgi:para-nitrobenzyl esterase